MTYRDFVEREARHIRSDKCTLSPDWNVWCCYEHDLACRYGKDPRDAYRAFKAGLVAPWYQAAELSRRNADKRFWRCQRTEAPSLKGRLWSDIAYLGVRLGDLWPF